MAPAHRRSGPASGVVRAVDCLAVSAARTLPLSPPQLPVAVVAGAETRTQLAADRQHLAIVAAAAAGVAVTAHVTPTESAAAAGGVPLPSPVSSARRTVPGCPRVPHLMHSAVPG